MTMPVQTNPVKNLNERFTRLDQPLPFSEETEQLLREKFNFIGIRQYQPAKGANLPETSLIACATDGLQPPSMLIFPFLKKIVVSNDHLAVARVVLNDESFHNENWEIIQQKDIRPGNNQTILTVDEYRHLLMQECNDIAERKFPPVFNHEDLRNRALRMILAYHAAGEAGKENKFHWLAVLALLDREDFSPNVDWKAFARDAQLFPPFHTLYRLCNKPSLENIESPTDEELKARGIDLAALEPKQLNLSEDALKSYGAIDLAASQRSSNDTSDAPAPEKQYPLDGILPLNLQQPALAEITPPPEPVRIEEGSKAEGNAVPTPEIAVPEPAAQETPHPDIAPSAAAEPEPASADAAATQQPDALPPTIINGNEAIVDLPTPDLATGATESDEQPDHALLSTAPDPNANEVEPPKNRPEQPLALPEPDPLTAAAQPANNASSSSTVDNVDVLNKRLQEEIAENFLSPSIHEQEPTIQGQLRPAIAFITLKPRQQSSKKPLLILCPTLKTILVHPELSSFATRLLKSSAYAGWKIERRASVNENNPHLYQDHLNLLLGDKEPDAVYNQAIIEEAADYFADPPAFDARNPQLAALAEARRGYLADHLTQEDGFAIADLTLRNRDTAKANGSPSDYLLLSFNSERQSPPEVSANPSETTAKTDPSNAKTEQMEAWGPAGDTPQNPRVESLFSQFASTITAPYHTARNICQGYRASSDKSAYVKSLFRQAGRQALERAPQFLGGMAAGAAVRVGLGMAIASSSALVAVAASNAVFAVTMAGLCGMAGGGAARIARDWIGKRKEGYTAADAWSSFKTGCAWGIAGGLFGFICAHGFSPDAYAQHHGATPTADTDPATRPEPTPPPAAPVVEPGAPLPTEPTASPSAATDAPTTTPLTSGKNSLPDRLFTTEHAILKEPDLSLPANDLPGYNAWHQTNANQCPIEPIAASPVELPTRSVVETIQAPAPQEIVPIDVHNHLPKWVQALKDSTDPHDQVTYLSRTADYAQQHGLKDLAKNAWSKAGETAQTIPTDDRLPSDLLAINNELAEKVKAGECFENLTRLAQEGKSLRGGYAREFLDYYTRYPHAIKHCAP